MEAFRHFTVIQIEFSLPRSLMKNPTPFSLVRLLHSPVTHDASKQVVFTSFWNPNLHQNRDARTYFATLEKGTRDFPAAVILLPKPKVYSQRTTLIRASIISKPLCQTDSSHPAFPTPPPACQYIRALLCALDSSVSVFCFSHLKVSALLSLQSGNALLCVPALPVYLCFIRPCVLTCVTT